MTAPASHDETLRRHRALVAPGTPLREGLERILRGRTGALVMLGSSRQVMACATGGFTLDTPVTPMALRELAKLDGALLLSNDLGRIVAAGVHLMPSAAIDTPETGTRHRTADRMARQTGVAAVTVSASMSTIALFLPDGRHPVDTSEVILSRANQALQTLERYTARLRSRLTELSILEVQDQVGVKDVVVLLQRLELVRRLERELGDDVLALGTDGRLLALQLRELDAGADEIALLLEDDYSLPERPITLDTLATLSDAELLEPSQVARTAGFGADEHLDSRLSPRGMRQLAAIPRLPAPLAARLLDHFGGLQALFAASRSDLQEVDGVGELRARAIRDGLIRLAEAAYTD